MSDPNVKLLLSADDKTAAAFAALNNRLGKVETSTKRVSDGFSNFGKVAAGVFAGIQIGGIVRDVTNLADAYKNANARLNVVSDSTEEFKSAQSALFDISQKTRTGLQQTTDLYAQLARGTKDMKLPQEQMLRLTEGINKAVTLSGSSVQGANAALVQLSQGFAAGALRGQEFMSVQEQAPVILETVRKGLGLTQAQLKELAVEGGLTNRKFIDGFFKGLGGLEDQFDKLPVTIEQSMTQIRNSLMKAIGTFDEATGASAGIARSITSVSESIAELGISYRNNKAAFDAVFMGIGTAAAVAGLSAIVTRFGAITTALTGMLALITANPVLLALLGIGVAVGGLSYLTDKSKEMPQTVTSAQERIARLQKQIAIEERKPEGLRAQGQIDAYNALIAKYKEYIDMVSKAGAIMNEPAAFDLPGMAKDQPVKDKAAEKEREKFLANLKKQRDALLYSDRELVALEAKRLGVNVQQALALFDQAQAQRDVVSGSKEAAKEAEDRLKAIMDAGKQEEQNNERQQNVIAAFRNQMEAYKDMLAVRNSGLLLSQEEIDHQERLNVLNKSYANAKLQLEKTGGVYLDINLEKLAQEYELMKQIIDKIKEKAEAQRSDLFGGFASGMQSYFNEISNFSKLTEDATVRAFRGMEDALVTFVQTGKLSFSDLARSIIADLTRIIIRQQMTGLFAGLLTPSVNLGASSIPDSAVSGSNFRANYNAVGMKAIGGSVQAGKPYIVGERGAEMFVPNQSGSIVPNGALGGGSVSVNIINNSNSQASAKETVDSRGNRRIDVTIGDMVAGEISRSGSKANSAIRNTFGASPMLAGR